MTFILPMYRGEATLQGCLTSLLALTVSDWECVGIDDASPDRCAEIFSAAASRDKRFRLERHAANSGVGAARATGLRLGRGAFVHLLDQDDHLAPDGIERALRFLRREASVPAVYGRFVVFDTRHNRRVEHKDMAPALDFDALLEGPPFCPIAVLHRRSAMEAAGGMSAEFDQCDDWDLWARIARLGPPLRHLPVVMGEWRVHDQNNSRNSLTTFRSGLRVLEGMHQADARVTTPCQAWRNGADHSRKQERILRFVWLQLANRLAHQDVRGAAGLSQEYLAHYGAGALPADSARHLDAAMPSARTLAGAEPMSYFDDLYDELGDLFEELEAQVRRPGYAAEAMTALARQHVRRVVATVRQLEERVEAYRTSRSYRLGRRLADAASALRSVTRRG